MMSNNRAIVRKIPKASLFVSEPAPRNFGNPPNERAGNKFWTNENWLKSRFHFSFAEYYNPKQARFGVLRVLNDDLVQPARGFGTHGHSNMEIATVVLQGELTHQDSMKNKETLSRGSVQYMSAGRGVRHSEQNLNPTLPLRFAQIWILTSQPSLPPRYGGFDGSHDPSLRMNRFQHVVSDEREPTLQTPIKLLQDVNIYLTEVDDPATKLKFSLKPDRQAYLLNAEGSCTLLNDGAGEKREIAFEEGDAAELFGPLELEFTFPLAGDKNRSFLTLIEMKYDGKSRFDEGDDDEDDD